MGDGLVCWEKALGWDGGKLKVKVGKLKGKLGGRPAGVRGDGRGQRGGRGVGPRLGRTIFTFNYVFVGIRR